VENMSYLELPDGTRSHVFGMGGGVKTAEDLGTQLLGDVPLIPAIREGGDRGEPIVAQEPDGPAARAFTAVARALLQRLTVTQA
jgi:ATP-binding protein involved in chromosome partitioning